MPAEVCADRLVDWLNPRSCWAWWVKIVMKLRKPLESLLKVVTMAFATES